jgi:hypothetical protein
MTRIVNVYKAAPGYSYEPADAVHIRVDIDMPADPPDDYAQHDASLIYDALYKSLPAGTLDALLATMVERHPRLIRQVQP